MSIWGKIIGAIIGLTFFKGPFGILFGAIAGHYWFDRKTAPKAPQTLANARGNQRAIDWARQAGRDDNDDDDDDDDDRRERRRQMKAHGLSARGHSGGLESTDEREVAFTIGVIALLAKMAKADGQVLRAEIDAFNKVFQVPQDQQTHVGKIFDLAKDSVAGFEGYAEQIRAFFSDKPGVMTDVLDACFTIAQADRQLHPGEEEYLRQVSRIFGLDNEQFQTIRAAYFGSDGSDPHVVLGLKSGASLAEAEKAFEGLMQESSPDAMQARGIPAELVQLAQKRREAYQAAIVRLRSR